jgi:hypothetical protein
MKIYRRYIHAEVTPSASFHVGSFLFFFRVNIHREKIQEREREIIKYPAHSYRKKEEKELW